MRAHADADHGDFLNLRIADDLPRADLRFDGRIQDIHRARIIAARNGKGKVRASFNALVLHNHIDVDMRARHRAEDLVRNSGRIGYAQHRNTRFIALVHNAGHHHLFHRLIFLKSHQGARTHFVFERPLEDEMRSGTLMTFEEDQTMEQVVVSGIAHQRDEARIAVLSVPDTPGIAYQILGPVARAHIDIDMIVQNQSVEGRTDFTFTVARSDYARAMDILNASVKAQIGARQVIGDPQVSKVSVIGVGMRSHVGVARTMFRTLAEEGINIQMISTSEIKISVLIDEKYMELAVRALHKVFELERG